ncbi:MAG TPA: diguanylate cyclase [Dehalococcoidia bacterium]|nr:diguanylate cyclase [Dehalococcoidia bacterium]
MKQDFQRSIGFHLWLSICASSLVITAITVLVYSSLTVSDGVHASQVDAQKRVDTLVATMARTRAGSTAQIDVTSAANLGLQMFDVIDARGQTLTYQRFGGPATPQSVDADLLSQAINGRPSGEDLQLAGDSYKDTSLNLVNVLLGGKFGHVGYVPFGSVVPGESGVLRVFLDYPALTYTAREPLQRAAFAGLIMLCLSLAFIWHLLNHFVSRPLQRYGDVALRMASGEQVRMPAEGRDEMSNLGRALNGMADALEHQATVDALTGLYNLRHLSSNLDAILAQAEATRTPVAVIVGDLDNLKPINDTYGHQSGDKLLRAVGDAVRAWTGVRNTCWRIGGDEFVVALPGADPTEAMQKASEFQRLIQRIKLNFNGDDVHTTISVGVATFPEDGDTTGSLVGVADRRMYMSKTMRDQVGKTLSGTAPTRAA